MVYVQATRDYVKGEQIYVTYTTNRAQGEFLSMFVNYGMVINFKTEAEPTILPTKLPQEFADSRDTEPWQVPKLSPHMWFVVRSFRSLHCTEREQEHEWEAIQKHKALSDATELKVHSEINTYLRSLTQRYTNLEGRMPARKTYEAKGSVIAHDRVRLLLIAVKEMLRDGSRQVTSDLYKVQKRMEASQPASTDR